MAGATDLSPPSVPCQQRFIPMDLSSNNKEKHGGKMESFMVSGRTLGHEFAPLPSPHRSDSKPDPQM